MDNGFIKVWKRIDKCRIVDFVMSTKGLRMHELRGRMRQLVANELHSQLITLIALFLDSPDLQSKYNDKPEQWKALREHMYTFVRLVIGFEAVEKGDMQKHVKAAKAVSSEESEPKA